MKLTFKSLLLASALCFASSANAALVSLDFTNIGMESGSSTTYSNNGDVWRATNVRVGGGPAMDAIFTITGASGVGPANASFADVQGRGNNMRVYVGVPGSVGNASLFINIALVNAGTTDAYTGFITGDTLITQFSDLDSDAGNDRADYAGVANGQFTEVRTSDNVTPGSSLLNIIEDPTYADGYTVGIMETPWGPQGNVTSTTASAQSPVTAAFLYDQPTTPTSIDIVVGQRVNGSITASRLIDIDMTPDFVIIPEPSAALLGGLGMLALLRRRRK